jgi:hypothetical protein
MSKTLYSEHKFHKISLFGQDLTGITFEECEFDQSLFDSKNIKQAIFINCIGVLNVVDSEALIVDGELKADSEEIKVETLNLES